MDSSLKDQAAAKFRSSDFPSAIIFYTQAIEQSPDDHTLYSNRSASHHKLNQFTEALKDGAACVNLKADWPKGYQRVAMAYHGLG